MLHLSRLEIFYQTWYQPLNKLVYAIIALFCPINRKDQPDHYSHILNSMHIIQKTQKLSASLKHHVSHVRCSQSHIRTTPFAIYIHCNFQVRKMTRVVTDSCFLKSSNKIYDNDERNADLMKNENKLRNISHLK